MAKDHFNLYWHLLESKRQAKIYLDQGKITPEDYNTLLGIDPSPTKKYVGWLSKIYITKEETDIDSLRNTVEEFDAFIRSGAVKAEQSDISGYKSFSQLRDVVDKLNKEGVGVSSSKLEGDFSVVVDNEELRIVAPYTHEASRKLGLTPIEKGGFAFRDCGEGKKDSQWCTTYSTPTHFNSYYFKENVDFFYTLVRGPELQQQLKSAGFGPEHFVVALARIVKDVSSVNISGKAVTAKNNQGQTVLWDSYDGYDKQLSPNKLQKWMGIVGIK